MRTMLAEQSEGGDLLGFVPRLPPDLPDRTFRVRASIASTLMSGLELARGAEVSLHQDLAFDPIAVRPRTARTAGETRAPA
jgi:hypothetical protein